MSYFAPIDFNVKTTSTPNKNLTKNNKNLTKNKFIYSNNPSESTHGHWIGPYTKSSVINNESNLKNTQLQSKTKTKLELNKKFNPSDYNLNYTNANLNNSNDLNQTYWINKNVGAGRGFGNLNISNEIRNGTTSRKDNKEFKEYREGYQTFDHQFQYLTRNYQDPSHLVMSIPRGGDSTRRQNQLEINNFRDTELSQINLPNLTKLNEQKTQHNFTY